MVWCLKFEPHMQCTFYCKVLTPFILLYVLLLAHSEVDFSFMSLSAFMETPLEEIIVLAKSHLLGGVGKMFVAAFLHVLAKSQ